MLEASEALGYRPNMAARSMRTGTTGAVGFVVSDIANPLFASIAKAADGTLSPRGYALVVANSANDAKHEAELTAALRQRRLDGLIVATADERALGLAERIDGFRAAVLLDREVPGSGADAVLSDHGAGIGAAVRHLAGLGHRRIAIIVGSPKQRGSRTRLEAFRAEVARLGLPLDDRLVRAGELSREAGYLAARALLALDEPPTALIAGNNQILTGVLPALRDLEIRIPSDLSLVACDETDLTVLYDPPIDVVRRDVAELGRVAAELILSRLASPITPSRRVVFPTTFETRASVAPPAPVSAKDRPVT